MKMNLPVGKYFNCQMLGSTIKKISTLIRTTSTMSIRTALMMTGSTGFRILTHQKATDLNCMQPYQSGTRTSIPPWMTKTNTSSNTTA